MQTRLLGALLIVGFVAVLYGGFVLMGAATDNRSDFRGESSPRSARQTDPRALCEIDALNLRLIELERQLRQANPSIGPDELQGTKDRARPLMEALARSDCALKARP